jgi:hypothetical protein
MNKSLVAIIAALIAAATTFSSAAEAGLKIHFGFGPVFHGHGNGLHAKRHYHRKRYIVRRVAKKKVYVAKKTTQSAPKVAKVEKVTKPEVVAAVPVAEEEVDVIADNENSSITSAALDPVEKTAAIEPEAETPIAVKAETETAKAEAKPAKAVSKLDCKKFFPSVGMTLTVPCE